MLNRRWEYERMAEAEGKLWWYRALHALVADAIRRHAPCAAPAILDAGCGTGGLMTVLRALGHGHVKGFDLSPDAVAVCHERGLNAVCGNLLDTGVLFDAASADVVVSNDTLCYFETDGQRQVLDGFRRVLRPGGLLILNVPALRGFGGIHDISVGIKVRFSRPVVRSLLDTSGFLRARENYWPFLLSPLIYGVRLKQRLVLRRRPDVEIRSDVDLPPAWLNELLGRITWFENRVLPWKPWGSSLFVVARKGITARITNTSTG